MVYVWLAVVSASWCRSNLRHVPIYETPEFQANLFRLLLSAEAIATFVRSRAVKYQEANLASTWMTELTIASVRDSPEVVRIAQMTEFTLLASTS